MKLLLMEEADPNALDQFEWTALHWAASKGFREVVKTLLRGGADPNLQSIGGWTPLDRAERNGHENVYNFLKGKVHFFYLMDFIIVVVIYPHIILQVVLRRQNFFCLCSAMYL